MLRPSTAAMPWRQRDRPGAGASVPLWWLPEAGADLPALRPGEQLLRPAVRARGAPAQGTGGGPALPGQPQRAAPRRGAAGAATGAARN